MGLTRLLMQNVRLYALVVTMEKMFRETFGSMCDSTLGKIVFTDMGLND